MIVRALRIGRWLVEFHFAVDSYNTDALLDRLYDFGAPARVMREALALMDEGGMNTGFTFTNPDEHLAIVAIGPSTGGDEFIDTLVHEVHHVAQAVAGGLGMDLDGEGPAYLSGDTARALADVVCRLGCGHCR